MVYLRILNYILPIPSWTVSIRISDFVGIIDEVAIFNSILSEEDLQSIMERELIKILGAESVLPTNLMTITWAKLKKSLL